MITIFGYVILSFREYFQLKKRVIDAEREIVQSKKDIKFLEGCALKDAKLINGLADTSLEAFGECAKRITALEQQNYYNFTTKNN